MGLAASEALTPRGLRSLREVARTEGVAATTCAPADNSALGLTQNRLDRLHRVVVAGDIDGVKTLLSAGASVDGRAGQGWNPSMHAANKG